MAKVECAHTHGECAANEVASLKHYTKKAPFFICMNKHLEGSHIIIFEK